MNKLYEESDIQAIADSIRAKNGLQDTYKVSEMSGAIDNIPIYSTLGATRQYGATGTGSGSTNLDKDFTLGANIKEAVITVLTIHNGGDETITCTKQSGADLSISTLLSNTLWDGSGNGAGFHCRTISYKITKAESEESVARIKMTNSYGFIDYHIVCVTN